MSKALILRDYQEKGVGEIRKSFIGGKRAPLYVLPTGGGKTVVFSYIAINTSQRNKRVLVLVHRIELLRQTSAKLIESNVDHGLINRKFTPNALANVQIASVQTMVKRLDKCRLDYDLIIIDEAHHAVANTWKKILAKIPAARVLGVTATPIRGDGTGLSDMFDFLIVGPTIKELTEKGHLVPSVVYAPSSKLDLSKVKIVNGDYDQRQIEDIVDNTKITGDAVENYAKICPGVPAVVFCVSIAHAEHVAEKFLEAGFRAQSVDGTMEDGQRRRLIGGLATGTVQVLTSCDLISEGTDVPCIRCVIGLRPTQSTGLYLQQIGRGLRPEEGKKCCYYLDHVGNVLMHGMPDEVRDWTLEGEDKRAKKKKRDQELNIRVKQCPQCFAMHPPAPACPLCQYKYVVEDATPPQIDGTLREIKPEDALAIQRMRNKEVGQAKTYEDLVAIGLKRNYRPGWAKHQWEAKKRKLQNVPPPVTEPHYPI